MPKELLQIMETPPVTPQKRSRPLGLALIIVGLGLLFGFLPISFSLFGGAIRINGGLDSSIWLNFILGVLMIIGSVAAWIGRPPWTRWLLIIAFWLTTIY